MSLPLSTNLRNHVEFVQKRSSTAQTKLIYISKRLNTDGILCSICTTLGSQDYIAAPHFSEKATGSML